MSVVDTGLSDSDSVLVELLRTARAGCNSSLGSLLQEYRDYLLLLADGELGSDLKVKVSSSDVVQESCLEAKRDFGQFAGSSPEEFGAWLRRVTLNNIANVIRAYRETEKRDLAREYFALGESGHNGAWLADAETQSASQAMLRNEQLEALRTALAKLPQHYQVVIQLRNYDRASFDDIGKHLGRSPEAARKLWVRAIELLQEELDVLNDSIRK